MHNAMKIKIQSFIKNVINSGLICFELGRVMMKNFGWVECDYVMSGVTTPAANRGVGWLVG